MSQRSEQIEGVRNEFRQASERLHACARRFDEASWAKRPAPERWSAAECVAHLNLTARGFLPTMDEAIERGERAAGASAGATEAAQGAARIVSLAPLRPGWVAGFFCKVLEPPVRLRVKTTPPFVPHADAPRQATLDDFDALQSQLLVRFDRAAPLDMNKIRVQSIFSKAFHYNLYACFKIIVAHERRHVWQMEQILEARD